MANLTQTQKTALKAFILGDPTLAALANTGQYGAIASALNVEASPAYKVWRTNVTRAEIYHRTSPEGTAWNWTTYKGQSQGEQGAWVQMFMGDQANFGLPNLRSGISAIFSGGDGTAQGQQRIHALAMGKRDGSVGEKALAIDGDGTTANPATMTAEGPFSEFDVDRALVEG